MNADHKGHRKRLKDKYIKGGLDILADHEVLELLLFYAIPRRNTNDIAHRLIDKYGMNLANIFEADIEDLKTVEGIGTNAAMLLSLIPQVVKRYKVAKWEEKKILGTTMDITNYAVDMYTGKTEEEFSILSLDSNRRVSNFDVICKGTVSEVNVYIRKVIEAALRVKAVNVVLLHNHPNGNLIPSQSDKNTTIDIIRLLDALGICVIDHVLVTPDGRGYSMKDMGDI